MKEKTGFNFALRWETELAEAAAATGGSKFSSRLMAVGAGGALVVIALAASPWLLELETGRQLQNINQKIATMSSINAQLQKMNDLKQKLQTEKQFLDAITKDNHDPIAVLNKLKMLLPTGTAVTSFAFTGDTVNLTVSVPTPVDVARLWSALGNSAVFQNVDIKSVSLADKVQNITFALKYNPSATLKLPSSASVQPGQPAQAGEGGSPPAQPATSQPAASAASASQPAASRQLDSQAAVSAAAASQLSGQVLVDASNDGAAQPVIRYPGIPQHVTATAAGRDRIELSWDKASFAVSYNVYRSTSPTTNFQKVANVPVPHYADTGLAQSTAYYYKVSSVKSNGIEGYFDNPAGATTGG